MSREKQIEEMACENCLHYKACLVNSEYVPSPCRAYENKAGYRKQSEWISVEERLPEHLEKVLVYDERGNMNTAMFLRYNNGNVDLCTSVRLTCQVTHWMPLPEAPKMKGGAE